MISNDEPLVKDEVLDKLSDEVSEGKSEKKIAPQAVSYYVTLKLYKTDEFATNSKGEKTSIINPKALLDIDSNNVAIGEFVNCGPTAFKAERLGDGSKVCPFKSGDFLIFKRNYSVPVKYCGIDYVHVSHEDLYGIVDDPEKFKQI